MNKSGLARRQDGAAASAIDSPRAWLRLVVCMLIGTVGSVGLWSVVVVIPAVQAEFGTDRADASMPYTLTMVGFALGNLLVGRAVDAFGVVRPLVATAVALCAGYVLAGSSATIWEFSLWQGLLVGMGTATCFGPLLADLSHWFRRRRGFALAAGATGNYLAGAVWPPIIQLVMASHGWRTTYVFIGITCLVLMLPLSLLLRERLSIEEEPVTSGGTAGPQARTAISPQALQWMLGIAGHLLLRRHVDAAGAYRRLLRGPGLRPGERCADAVGHARRRRRQPAGLRPWSPTGSAVRGRS